MGVNILTRHVSQIEKVLHK